MRPRSQHTIRRPVSVAGVGYWSGRGVVVDLLPAPAGCGVVIVRSDLDTPVRVVATVEHRIDARLRTTLAVGGVRVQMVEHLLSALAGTGVDCCIVRVSGEELPGLDGSARAFVEAIDSVGLEDLGRPADPLVVADVVRVEDGEAWLEASPPRHAGLSVEYLLDYPAPVGRQSLTLVVTPESYRESLAAARTFITAAEAEQLRAAGLCGHVTPRDLIVFGPEGPLDNSLRWPDECVRHKVLDLVGDLALVGRPLHAHVRAARSGHRLNAALAARLVATVRRRASA